MNQTPEELAEQLAKRLAIEHLPHPFELSALPLILSAIQSATQPLVHRVKELEAVIHEAGITIGSDGRVEVDLDGERFVARKDYDALTARVKELETALQHSAGITERLTAENAELRKLLRAVLDEHNKGMCEDSEFGNSNGPYMPPSITLRIRQAIDQARNQ
jgi:hypothetical protein